MEIKHYKMLGGNVRRIIDTTRFKDLTDELMGRMIVQYVELLQKEAERDARDKVNGKGEYDRATEDRV